MSSVKTVEYVQEFVRFYDLTAVLSYIVVGIAESKESWRNIEVNLFLPEYSWVSQSLKKTY